jgi:chromosome partitioning protein
MLIVVASEKGGTGKTTIATNLAIMRAQEASDVLLVDADLQNSSMDFSAVRDLEGHDPHITATALTGRGIAGELRKLVPKFDDIIVDVGGRDTTSLRGSLLVADVLLVPFLASQYDTWSLERMDALIDEVKPLNENLRVLSLLNKVDANPKLDLVEDAVRLVKDYKNLPLCSQYVGYRVAFRRSVAEGLGITELKRAQRDNKAIFEMNVVYKEVFGDA